MENQDLPIKLNTPTPTKRLLNFCPSTAEGVAKWVKNLPLANTGETARQLYTAIEEINNWQTSALLRLKVVEIIRPYIYSINTQLAKHFLVNNIALNERQLKIAQLSQALQVGLANSYKLIIKESLIVKKPELSTKAFSLAVHRAISEISQRILLSYQLYRTPAEFCWLEINQLFLLAEANSWLDIEHEDKQTKFLSQSSIAQRFIRVHLLASAKPNNLRQQELASIFSALELWVKDCNLVAVEDVRALFIVNLYRDRTAIFKQNLNARQHDFFRGIETTPLIKRLKLCSGSAEQQKEIVVPKQITDSLLNHVIQAWSVHAQRVFRRIDSSGHLQICLGLAAIHFYCSDMRSFERSLSHLRADLKQIDYNKERARNELVDDVWATAFDADSRPEGFTSDADIIYTGNGAVDDNEIKYPTHNINIVNASPGGYSTQWKGALPSGLQAGELLGVKEEDSKHWAIAVIRWIQRVSSNDTKMGVELLSPSAEAGAAQLLQKTGANGPFLRALMLPEIKAIAQPPSLIVPNIPFRTGNKVELLFENLMGRHQLVKRQNSTNSFSQFQFRQVGVHTQVNSPSLESSDSFDMLWSKL